MRTLERVREMAISQLYVTPYGEPCDAVWDTPSVTPYDTATYTVWGDGSFHQKPGERLFLYPP